MGIRQPSRRSVLKKLAAVSAAGVAGPLISSCASGPAETLASVDDLGGAALEAVMRGSFIPQLDAITVDVGRRWEERRNASIEIVLHEEWRTLTAQVIADGQGADIADLFGNEPHLYAEHLVDVSDLAERVGDSLGGWSEDARAVCMVDGVWRAVPWSTTRHAMVVRTDLVAEVGKEVPQTYDDLLEVAVLLSEAGAPPVGFTMAEAGSSDASALAYGMLWSFGGQELSDDGRVALNSAATIASLEYFAELSKVNAVEALSYGHPDNNNAYLGGDIAITQNPPSIYLRALETDPALAEMTIHSPLPEGPAGQFQLPEIDSLAVFRHSSDPVAAKDWIEFASQGSVLVDRARESLAFHAPAVLGLDDDPEMPWNTDERLLGLSSMAAEGRMPGWPLRPGLEAGLVYDNASILNMFRSVGTGDLTPRESVAAATEELRRVYET